jgi:diguanylate cyclase (GGDEF)-like protein
LNDTTDDRRVRSASRTLAQLRLHVEERRAELLALRRTLAKVPRNLSAPGEALIEANEQLVLAALRAESIAETAVSNLDELARTSQRDPLTDTPNRALMLDRLDKAIAMARRHRTRLAVVFVDLDHFKQINDNLGHAVGDAVLQLAARNLEGVVREADTVSRHGGDEFLVLLTDISQPSDAALIAEKMLGAFSAPKPVGDRMLPLSVSIGIAIYPEDGEQAATLIGHADAAIYRSKKQGGGNFQFYSAANESDRSRESSSDGMPQPPVEYVELRRDNEPRLRDLREANEHLVLAALTAQELETNAEAAYRKQIEFLAMVAHELRHPLSPIRGAADALKHVRVDERQLARLQEVIEDQVAHMTRRIDDLLDASRITTDRLRLERRTVEITAILNRAVETCRPAMDTRHQHLQVQLPASPLKVQGDPVQLTKSFTYLLDNASRHAPEGGEIALAVAALDDAIEIAVSDNGIAAEAQPNLLAPSAQNPHALTSPDGGNDIGLAIARDLIEAHGGTVVDRSADRNHGNEFIVELPLVDTPPEA